MPALFLKDYTFDNSYFPYTDHQEISQIQHLTSEDMYRVFNVEPFSEKLKDYPVEYPFNMITHEFKKRELKQLEKGDIEL